MKEVEKFVFTIRRQKGKYCELTEPKLKITIFLNQ